MYLSKSPAVLAGALAVLLSGAELTQAYVFSITPPPTLQLVDGPNGLQTITTGTFNLTGLIGFSQTQTTGFTILDPLNAVDDIAQPATIGSGIKMGLIDVDPQFEVLRFTGFFDSPVLTNPAQFEGIMGVSGTSGPSDFTIFLPSDTTQPLRTQLTSLNLDTELDNLTRFVEVGLLSDPTLQIAPSINLLTPGAEVFTLSGNPANGVPNWFVGIGGPNDPGGSGGGGGTAALTATQASVTTHGTGGIGGCITGIPCKAIWNGGAGDWSIPSNWDIGLVPVNGSSLTFDVFIDNGAGGVSVVNLSNSPAVNIVDLDISQGDRLEIGIGGSLAVNGTSIKNAGVIQIQNGLPGGSAILFIPNIGAVTLTGGGEVVLTQATGAIIDGGFGALLINEDNTIRGAGTVFMPLTNQATIRAEGGSLSLNRDIDGTGDIFVSAGATLIFNGGTLQQQTLTVDPLGVFDFNGQRLEIVDFIGDFNQDAGTYAPGASPAISSLSGDYTLGSSATLEIEIGGFIPGTFDQLLVGGGMTLSSGTLSVVTLGGFTPAIGDTFVVADAVTGVSGQFGSVLSTPFGSGLGYKVLIDELLGTVTLEVVLPGDLNGDGFVGIEDLNSVLGAWNQSVTVGDPLLDPSGDGFVGIEDLNIVLGNWNGGSLPPPEVLAMIPEPGTLGLLLIGAGVLAGRKRR